MLTSLPARYNHRLRYRVDGIYSSVSSRPFNKDGMSPMVMDMDIVPELYPVVTALITSRTSTGKRKLAVSFINSIAVYIPRKSL